MSRRIQYIAIALLLLNLCYGAVPAAKANDLIDIGDVAVVSTTEGDVLTLRGGPGLDYGAIRGLPAGTEVQVLDGPVYSDGIGWYQISSGGLIGWCAGEWLMPPTQASGTRYVEDTAGGGVWLRDEPGLGGATLLLIPEGGAVVLLGAASYADDLDWTLARYGGTTGWVASGFLNGAPAGQGGGPVGTVAPVTIAPASAGELFIGDRAVITGTDGQDVRIRDGIGVTAPIFSFVPEGSVVLLVNGPLFDDQGSAWYGIDYDGIQGWVFGGYLGQSVSALSQRTGAAIYDPARGEAIVTEAMRHLDVPYVWGGDGPRGWDCSGMVQWLYGTVAGINLPRVSQDQFFVGTPLRRDEIQPGDIVFFADTDGPGITHNGIAIGGDLFIHARDESRGTTISSLYDPLFVLHYAGARRP